MEVGRAKQVALALSDEHMPVDAMGFPVGKTTGETAKVIKRPLGVTQVEWLTAIDVAVEHFRQTAGLVKPTATNLAAISELRAEVWEILFSPEFVDLFHSALALKGIMKKGSGLTFEQRRCLNVLTDLTMKGDIQSRLKKIGIAWEVFQNWLKDAKFKSQLDAITEAVSAEAEPLIMMELTRGATEGNLAKIQYFHQLSGRFDPNKDMKADFKAFTVGLVEILQGEIEDSEVLRKIAGRLTELQKKTIGE